MSFVGSIIDPSTGRPIAAGAIRKRLVDATFLGAVPAPLLATGTVTHSIPPASVGFLQVATGAAVGDGASLATSYAVPMHQYDAIKFTVQGPR
jgi:hypothetical protein